MIRLGLDWMDLLGLRVWLEVGTMLAGASGWPTNLTWDQHDADIAMLATDYTKLEAQLEKVGELVHVEDLPAGLSLMDPGDRVYRLPMDLDGVPTAGCILVELHGIDAIIGARLWSCDGNAMVDVWVWTHHLLEGNTISLTWEYRKKLTEPGQHDDPYFTWEYMMSKPVPAEWLFPFREISFVGRSAFVPNRPAKMLQATHVLYPGEDMSNYYRAGRFDQCFLCPARASPENVERRAYTAGDFSEGDEVWATFDLLQHASWNHGHRVRLQRLSPRPAVADSGHCAPYDWSTNDRWESWRHTRQDIERWTSIVPGYYRETGRLPRDIGGYKLPQWLHNNPDP